MNREKGRFYRANVWGQLNGVGVILTILMAAIVGFSNSGYNGKPPFTRGIDPLLRNWIDATLLSPTILLSLVQQRVELDAEARIGRLGWGAWPLFRWRSLTFTGPTELVLTGGQGPRGWSVTARLRVLETGEIVPLAKSGGELQMEEVLPFARRLDARISASRSVEGITSESLRRLIPEAFESQR